MTKAIRILIFVVALVVFFAISLILVASDGDRVAAWVVACVGMVLIFAAIGGLTGRSILTDDRNRWSLSRLQVLAWTWLILSSLWTMVLVRLFAKIDDPVSLGMNENLWALLGISLGSLVGAPILLERKRNDLEVQPAPPATPANPATATIPTAVTAPTMTTVTTAAAITTTITVPIAPIAPIAPTAPTAPTAPAAPLAAAPLAAAAANIPATVATPQPPPATSPANPPPPAPGAPGGKLSDFFRGEDEANKDTVDVPRTQMFLFTAICVFIYFMQCLRAFQNLTPAALQFPAMSQNLVILIGISHATYLAGKVPRKP